MQVRISDIKKLREETSAGVADCRKALEDAKGDYAKAKKLIEERGIEKASKREGEQTGEGRLFSYVHNNGKVGVLVILRCQTDFVAKTDAFAQLGHEIALQIAAMNPKDAKDLLEGSFIRDPKLTVENLIKQTIAKVGENITVGEFKRISA